MRKIRPFVRGNRGQHMVEFAVVLPVLLLFLMGCIDFGNVFYRLLTLNEAARAAARAVAVSGDCNTAVTPGQAFGSVSGITVNGGGATTYSLFPTNNMPSARSGVLVLSPNGNVTITVTRYVPVSLVTKKFFQFGGFTLDSGSPSKGVLLTATANMRLEVFPSN